MKGYVEIRYLFIKEATIFGFPVTKPKVDEHISMVKEEGFGMKQRWRLREDPRRPNFLYMDVRDVDKIYLPFLHQILDKKGEKLSSRSLCMAHTKAMEKAMKQKNLEPSLSADFLLRYFNNQNLIEDEKIEESRNKDISNIDEELFSQDESTENVLLIDYKFTDFIIGFSEEDLSDYEDDSDMCLIDLDDDYDEEDYDDDTDDYLYIDNDCLIDNDEE